MSLDINIPIAKLDDLGITIENVPNGSAQEIINQQRIVMQFTPIEDSDELNKEMEHEMDTLVWLKGKSMLATFTGYEHKRECSIAATTTGSVLQLSYGSGSSFRNYIKTLFLLHSIPFEEL